MDEDWIIQASGVQKIYHTGLVSVPALRGIDLCVQRGRDAGGDGTVGLRENDAAELSVGTGYRRRGTL